MSVAPSNEAWVMLSELPHRIEITCVRDTTKASLDTPVILSGVSVREANGNAVERPRAYQSRHRHTREFSPRRSGAS
jgi:hypothetical protein